MKIPIISYHTLLMIVVSSVAAAPTVCISTPILMAEAGSVVKATIDGFLSERRCEATLKFSNQDFPHIHFGFEYLTCLGDLQLAEFTIPLDAPNGDAFLLWHCTGQDSPICNHIWITEGEGNLESIVLDQSGTMACLVPTATQTTLATITGTSNTLTEAIASTYFEEIVPTTTIGELLTLSDASTTMIESLISTYFSNLSESTSTTESISASNRTASRLGAGSFNRSTAASSMASTTSPISTASTLVSSLSLTIIAIGTSLTTISPPTTSTTTTSTTTTLGGNGVCVTNRSVSCTN